MILGVLGAATERIRLGSTDPVAAQALRRLPDELRGLLAFLDGGTPEVMAVPGTGSDPEAGCSARATTAPCWLGRSGCRTVVCAADDARAKWLTDPSSQPGDRQIVHDRLNEILAATTPDELMIMNVVTDVDERMRSMDRVRSMVG